MEIYQLFSAYPFYWLQTFTSLKDFYPKMQKFINSIKSSRDLEEKDRSPFQISESRNHQKASICKLKGAQVYMSMYEFSGFFLVLVNN